MTDRPDIDAIEARLKAATHGEWRNVPGDAAIIAHAPTELAALVAYVRELEGRSTEAATLQLCHLCHRRPYRFSAAVDPCDCLGGKCRCDGCEAYRELAPGDAIDIAPLAVREVGA